MKLKNLNPASLLPILRAEDFSCFSKIIFVFYRNKLRRKNFEPTNTRRREEIKL